MFILYVFDYVGKVRAYGRGGLRFADFSLADGLQISMRTEKPQNRCNFPDILAIQFCSFTEMFRLNRV